MAWLTLHLNAAAVHLYDVLGGEKTQPRPLVLGSVERLEELGHLCLGYARAIEEWGWITSRLPASGEEADPRHLRLVGQTLRERP